MNNNKQHQPIISDKTYVRVLYKDTDQMGFVYYANYLVWFELGRAELMRKIGLPYRQVEAQGVYLPVSRCICNYKAPARYDDLLRIETSILELTEISITFSYKIYREETGEILTTGETKHAFLNREGKFTRYGRTLKNYILQYTNSTQ